MVAWRAVWVGRKRKIHVCGPGPEAKTCRIWQNPTVWNHRKRRASTFFLIRRTPSPHLPPDLTSRATFAMLIVRAPRASSYEGRRTRKSGQQPDGSVMENPTSLFFGTLLARLGLLPSSDQELLQLWLLAHPLQCGGCRRYLNDRACPSGRRYSACQMLVC